PCSRQARSAQSFCGRRATRNPPRRSPQPSPPASPVRTCQATSDRGPVMRSWFIVSSVFAVVVVPAAACGVGSDCDFGLCAGSPVGSDDGGDSADRDAIVPPPECADPKGKTECVSDYYGVFVSTQGSDSNPGTMKAPVQTINAALAKLGPKQRVF